MKEFELSDREDCAPLTTATSPHKQLSQNGALHIHRQLVLWTYTISFVEISPRHMGCFFPKWLNL